VLGLASPNPLYAGVFFFFPVLVFGLCRDIASLDDTIENVVFVSFETPHSGAGGPPCSRHFVSVGGRTQISPFLLFSLAFAAGFEFLGKLILSETSDGVFGFFFHPVWAGSIHKECSPLLLLEGPAEL